MFLVVAYILNEECWSHLYAVKVFSKVGERACPSYPLCTLWDRASTVTIFVSYIAIARRDTVLASFEAQVFTVHSPLYRIGKWVIVGQLNDTTVICGSGTIVFGMW